LTYMQSLAVQEMPRLLGHRRFRAMNTEIQIYALDTENLEYVAAVEDLVHSIEARLSRFLPDSELCRFNRRVDAVVGVSGLMLEVLSKSLDLHYKTGGIFDPAVLADLERAGYDRSFQQVPRAAGNLPVQPEGTALSISQLRLDRERSTAAAPQGLRIDLGGIGKGYAVDGAARLLEPARDFLVNAGGDIFASGDGPDGDGWLVGVTNPRDIDASISLVRLHNEALATSTTAVRRWQRDGRWLHHLIDPRTRQPAESGVISVTVVAPTATEADVYAKTALLLGLKEGPGFLERRGTPGFFITEDGGLIHTSGWSGTSCS